ncbi:HD domain-containing protein [Succiniclasticum ruminis]|uniref:HD domain-containing protein n=1 Tax=Succiniclasticum ruminis DSM 9236 TaxID=1123323 RepID=A0A1I2A3F0_9FIRM|nr:HD domain-containing protein [Succiniclasticum ruminis]SFE38481.1 HD domain-containing protein [Succiniclasticum ruminis DSM 9236]
MEHAEVVRRMVLFDKGDARRIQHFLKVYMFAALIGKMEGLPPEQQEVLEIAAILHDIGIIPAEKKYGFNNGKLQEQEGPAYARALLQEAGGYQPELIDRVCFLIAHHHTYEGVDGPDWQILLEADFLVNSFEKNMPEEAIKKMRSRVFKTGSGIAMLNNQYGYDM